MKRRQDHHAKLAEQIAASEDPRAAMLEFMRVASQMERNRRRRVRAGLSVLLGSFVALGLWHLGRVPRPPGDQSQPGAGRPPLQVEADSRATESELDWLESVRLRPAQAQLLPQEVERVRSTFRHPAPEVRRLALTVATLRNIRVEDDYLLWFLSNEDTSDDAPALHLVWFNAARTGSFVSPETLEEFALAGVPTSQEPALRALGELKTYSPSQQLLESLETAPSSVRKAAKKLLKKAGQ